MPSYVPYRFFAVSFAALCLFGCSPKAPGRSQVILLTLEQLSRRVPDGQTKNSRVWFVEKTQGVGVYYTELTGSVPLQARWNATLRIFVLTGRMKIRAGPKEEIVGSGAYISIPPKVPYRILRIGPERLLYAVVVTPDDHRLTMNEDVSLLRQMENSSL